MEEEDPVRNGCEFANLTFAASVAAYVCGMFCFSSAWVRACICACMEQNNCVLIQNDNFSTHVHSLRTPIHIPVGIWPWNQQSFCTHAIAHITVISFPFHCPFGCMGEHLASGLQDHTLAFWACGSIKLHCVVVINCLCLA